MKLLSSEAREVEGEKGIRKGGWKQKGDKPPRGKNYHFRDYSQLERSVVNSYFEFSGLIQTSVNFK